MEPQLTKEESLALITKMIQQAKQSYLGASFYFLFWGWIVIIAYLGHYLLLVNQVDAPFLIWLIMIPAWIVSIVYGIRQRNRSGIKSYTGHMYNKIWFSLVIPFLGIIGFGYSIGYDNITGLILLLVGSGAFMTGQLMKFKPIIYGSVFIWAGGILALIYNQEFQYLIGAFSVALGYLVPGYMLKSKENNG